MQPAQAFTSIIPPSSYHPSPDFTYTTYSNLHFHHTPYSYYPGSDFIYIQTCTSIFSRSPTIPVPTPLYDLLQPSFLSFSRLPTVPVPTPFIRPAQSFTSILPPSSYHPGSDSTFTIHSNLHLHQFLAFHHLRPDSPYTTHTNFHLLHFPAFFHPGLNTTVQPIQTFLLSFSGLPTTPVSTSLILRAQTFPSIILSPSYHPSPDSTHTIYSNFHRRLFPPSTIPVPTPLYSNRLFHHFPAFLPSRSRLHIYGPRKPSSPTFPNPPTILVPTPLVRRIQSFIFIIFPPSTILASAPLFNPLKLHLPFLIKRPTYPFPSLSFLTISKLHNPSPPF
ncbi:mucin-2-like [Latimeria chalumnae]|uniref:mucin-2-like n=1 Tax=Latimeria chalumnae TaxID=7897 RepID=UPI00313C0431